MNNIPSPIQVFARGEGVVYEYEDGSRKLSSEMSEGELAATQYSYYLNESKKRGGFHAVHLLTIRNPRCVGAIRSSGRICDPEIGGSSDSYFAEIPFRPGKTITLENGVRVRQNGSSVYIKGDTAREDRGVMW